MASCYMRMSHQMWLCVKKSQAEEKSISLIFPLWLQFRRVSKWVWLISVLSFVFLKRCWASWGSLQTCWIFFKPSCLGSLQFKAGNMQSYTHYLLLSDQHTTKKPNLKNSNDSLSSSCPDRQEYEQPVPRGHRSQHTDNIPVTHEWSLMIKRCREGSQPLSVFVGNNAMQ